MSIVTQNRLLELFEYDQTVGNLVWRKTVGSRAKAGAIAGTKTSKGHLVVRVDGKLLSAHYIVWVICVGSAPSGSIIHINKNKTDNRFSNLAVTSKTKLHLHTKAVELRPDNVNEIFYYDDGALLWRESLTGKSRVKDREAGYKTKDGYKVVQVAGRSYGVHRIVWLLHTGMWPQGEIDHINGVRHDNRIENLRDVAHITNSENRSKAAAGSSTGFLGVSLHKDGLFRARIRISGKLKSLGLYGSAEEAHAAYLDAKRMLHAGCVI